MIRKKKNVTININWFVILPNGVKCFARTRFRKMEEFYNTRTKRRLVSVFGQEYTYLSSNSITHTSINNILVIKCGTSFCTNSAMTRNVAPPCNKKSRRKWKPSNMSKTEYPMVMAGKMRWRLVRGVSPHWPGFKRTISGRRFWWVSKQASTRQRGGV